MAAVTSMMTMRAPAALHCGAVQRKSTLGGHTIIRLPHKSLEVKCMAKDPEESSSSLSSTKFGDLFAPEGRAAMLGFVSAITLPLTEYVKGGPLV